MLRRLSALALLLVLTGCSTTEPTADEVQFATTAGLDLSASEASVGITAGLLAAALTQAEPVTIVATVDHAANASGAGLTLRPTRVVLFGNPMLGTPIMQANQQAGLDLPQNMLVYQDADGVTIVGYNTTAYLAARHGVGGVAALDQIDAALSAFVTASVPTASNRTRNGVSGITRGEGIVTVASQNSVDVTYSRLKAAIQSNENLTLVAELDHAANAASVGMELRPTRLLVFGNPNLGTPLMQASQTTAIDLPQKMLVYEGASGAVTIAYNAPAFLASRHSITGQDDVLATISSALAGLASGAASSN